MDEQIRAYSEVCAGLAQKLAGGSRARRVGAEYDDLYQEGLISVWFALRKGVTPSVEQIEFRMRKWMRYLNRQTPADYEELLPLDESGADFAE